MHTISLPEHTGIGDAAACGLSLGPWLNPQLRAATEHALRSEGGGFRARLVEALGAALGLETGRVEALSTGLEYFHLASLVLDDLPCMDDAQMRRGMPCTHRIYGDATAILSALALINRAYFLVWDSLRGLSPTLQEQANQLLDECLGINGMLNGQSTDLGFALTDRSPATIERIAREKTGALLRLSMLLPAIAAGLDPELSRVLGRIAVSWGYIYQLLDDFKDVEWGESASGKTPGRDATLDRPNLAIALGKDRALARLRRRLGECRGLMHSLVDADPGLARALDPFQKQLERAGEDFLAACAA